MYVKQLGQAENFFCVKESLYKNFLIGFFNASHGEGKEEKGRI